MAKQKNPHISFLIVNYNTDALLGRCLRTVATIAGHHAYEVLIADNSTMRNAPLPSFDKNTTVFPLKDNRGFGTAINHLARHARGTYLFILNPDTHHFDGDITQLLTLFDDSSVGIVAPRLLTQTDHDEKWSYGNMTITPLTIILSHLMHWHHPHPQKHNRVAWVSGAALLIPRTLFETLRGFDERFFLYYEDVDLCRRVRAKGLDIIRSPHCTIHHDGGASMPSHHIKKKCFDQSQRAYITKYHSAIACYLITAIQKCKRLLQKTL